MNKVILERNIFKKSEVFWKQIYGKYKLRDKHNDKPDIIIDTSTGVAIGIEITQIDNQEHLEYFNGDSEQERKYRANLENKEITLKKDSFNLVEEKRVILNQILKKNNKFTKYKTKVKDCCLLVFTERFHLSTPNSKYLFQYLENKLVKKKFKYRYVLLVMGEQIQVIYKKNSSQIRRLPEYNKEVTTTEIQTSMLRVDTSYKFNEFFDSDPLIPKKSQ